MCCLMSEIQRQLQWGLRMATLKVHLLLENLKPEKHWERRLECCWGLRMAMLKVHLLLETL